MVFTTFQVVELQTRYSIDHFVFITFDLEHYLTFLLLFEIYSGRESNRSEFRKLFEKFAKYRTDPTNRTCVFILFARQQSGSCFISENGGPWTSRLSVISI